MKSPLERMQLDDLHILLVDDSESDVLNTLKAFALAGLSYTIDAVGDGIEAMAYLRQEGKFSECKTPDLVLLDLDMPRMDGHETIAAIRADGSLDSVPVLIFTTSSRPEDMETSFRNHAHCFVTKPSTVEEFSGLVQSVAMLLTIHRGTSVE